MDLMAGIVRILHPQKGTVGTGFLVSNDGLIVTCAHVMRSAGADAGTTATVRFYDSHDTVQAQVIGEWWRPVDAEDLAILKIEGDLPADVEPLPLGESSGTRGHRVRTFGFPNVGDVDGLPGEGEVLGDTFERGQRLIAMRSAEITTGFSGAPVWDESKDRVIGIVVSIAKPDSNWRLAQVSFILPSETLQAVCPELRHSDFNPYKGLAFFATADASFFFGRRAFIGRLLNRLRDAPRSLALFGPSGSGKSSVVRAGLIPALTQGKVQGSERWGVVITRPGTDPFQQMADQGLPSTGEGLPEAIEKWLQHHSERSRLVLVIDQFEELFTSCLGSLAQEFISGLTQLINSSVDITVVIVMRSDFYIHFSEQAPGLLELLERNIVNIPPYLSQAELTEIVQKPAEVVGIRFADGLVHQVVRDALESEGEENELQAGRATILPLLEFCLSQLWEERQDGELTFEAYEAIERVGGSLSQWANREFYSLDEDSRTLAQRVFKALVRLGDESEGIPNSRRRRTMDELSNKGALEEVPGIVQGLADARLLVTARDVQSGLEMVEVIHDSLLREWKLLQQWLKEDKEFLVWRDRLRTELSEWNRTEKNEELLLRGPPLVEAKRWLRERAEDLNSDEQGFIRQSVALQEATDEAERQRFREQAERTARDRVRRRQFFGLAGGIVMVTLLAIVAVQQCTVAGNQRQIARSLQLAADANSRLSEQLDLGLLLSLEARKLDDSVHTRGNLLNALTFAPGPDYFLRFDPLGVNDVAFSPDGEALASGVSDRTIILWDVETGQQDGEALTGHRDLVSAVLFSPASDLMASGSGNGEIIIWDMKSRQPRFHLNGHTGLVTSLAFSPDGLTLASVGQDNSVVLWDVESGRMKEELPDQATGSIVSIAFSQETSELLALGSDSSTIILWNTATGQLETLASRAHVGGVRALAFSPDKATLASGSDNGAILLWNVRERKVKGAPLPINVGYVRSLAFSDNGKVLASGGTSREIVLWDVENQRQFGQPLRGHTAPVNGLAFSPKDMTLASVSEDHTIIVWNLGSHPRLARPIRSDNATVKEIAFSSDGQLFASLDGSNVSVWDLGAAQPELRFQNESLSVSSMSLSPDGSLLALGNREGSITIWDWEYDRLVTELAMIHDTRVTKLAFSPGGAFLASGSNDGTVVIWDLGSGQPVGRPQAAHRGPVKALAFSHDDTLLASGSDDRTAILWDVETGQPTGNPLANSPAKLMSSHRLAVDSLAFSPDNRVLASGSDDRTIILWDVQSRQPIIELSEHEDRITGLDFSPDGRMLASGGEDLTIILWDLETRTPVGRPLEYNDGFVNDLEFTPDGKLLASANGTEIVFWDVDVSSWTARACRIAARNLSIAELDTYLPGERNHKTCSNMP